MKTEAVPQRVDDVEKAKRMAGNEDIGRKLSPGDQEAIDHHVEVNERRSETKKLAEAMSDVELKIAEENKTRELKSVWDDNPQKRDRQRQLLNAELMALREIQKRRKDIEEARKRVKGHFPDIKEVDLTRLANDSVEGENAL